MDAAGWNSGSVPTAGSTVVIPSGIVTIRVGEHAEAKHVHVETGARLNVYVKSSLTIIGSDKAKAGLLNEGRTYVWGDLLIANTSNDISTIVSGIRTTDYFFVGVDGEVNVQNVSSGYGILNSTSGAILNRGLITMTQVDFDNIRNLSVFDNEGDIELHDINTNGILNKGEFTSDASSFISLMDGNIGILNNPNASIENHGFVNIDDSNYGVVNKGNFVNQEEGLIYIWFGIQGLTNRSITGAGNGDYMNYGRTHIDGCGTGARNEDYIYNEGNFYCYYTNTTGLKNITGVIENDGLLVAYGTSLSVFNEASVINGSEGYFFVNNVIENFSIVAYIENNAFLISEGESPHILDAAGTLINHGVVEDHYNAFSGAGFDNQQLYISRILETLEDGNVYGDLIELVDYSNIYIQEWKDINTNTYNEVGSYDENLNQLTANSYAEDIDRIYIRIEILASGNNRNTSLFIDEPTSPRLFNNDNHSDLSLRGNVPNDDILIYPNPTTDNINIKFSEALDQPVEYNLYNSMGQCILRKAIMEGESKTQVELDDRIHDDMYYLVVRKAGQVISSEKVFKTK